MITPTGVHSGQEPEAAALAVLACQGLILESYERVDAGRRSSLADLLTEDGSHAIDDDVATGREQVRSTLAARDAVPGRRTLHAVTNLHVRAETADRARARYGLLLFLLSGGAPTTPRVISTVEDVLVRHDGRWLLHSRHIRTLAGG
ncbi:nuclear transport factor 2 family protein [Mycobacterium intracellulare]|uniref:nuclear transport factor 2 family protein n=1 Tax=Mycobacterium intracellulare TaxID=1767 RepID=UPI001CDA2F99|nr:nuclear transport factor 2 family protein [Mycobacterium intracellulare]MCA2276749.1 nuclear transport factor 2 family protein [Mycobacterium intracellulare]MCA2328452.1 nuclear transport factor 2 family protein [Mycobacterium intracellulare]